MNENRQSPAPLNYAAASPPKPHPILGRLIAGACLIAGLFGTVLLLLVVLGCYVMFVDGVHGVILATLLNLLVGGVCLFIAFRFAPVAGKMIDGR